MQSTPQARCSIISDASSSLNNLSDTERSFIKNTVQRYIQRGFGTIGVIKKTPKPAEEQRESMKEQPESTEDKPVEQGHASRPSLFSVATTIKFEDLSENEKQQAAQIANALISFAETQAIIFSEVKSSFELLKKPTGLEEVEETKEAEVLDQSDAGMIGLQSLWQ